MPALFLGHGNPMNALADNTYTQAWRHLGATLPRPRAVLCISAHWYAPFTAVTAMDSPRTIHDFGGFPQALFDYHYPAPGSRALAQEVAQLLGPQLQLDTHWGLDHGTWAVLCHVYPQADVPVVQLSLDERLPAPAHYQLGRQLARLREEGVLIVGSGNIVHNLHAYAWGRKAVEPYDWAVKFEADVRACIEARSHLPLMNYESLGRAAMLSVPTPEHYLPLLYVLGAAGEDEPVSFPISGMDGGSISMLSVQVG